jgi:hypothetical protein
MKVILSFLLLIIVAQPGTVLGSQIDSVINTLEGKWGWGNCEDNKHTIKASQNKEFLEFIVENGSYYYFIAGLTHKGLKVVMMHEDRFDDQNNLVYWYVVMDGKDKYFWLRSDRKENDLRGPVSRCK